MSRPGGCWSRLESRGFAALAAADTLGLQRGRTADGALKTGRELWERVNAEAYELLWEGQW